MCSSPTREATAKQRLGILLGVAMIGICDGVHAAAIDWIKQLGTPEVEIAHEVAVDSLGHVYVTGHSLGSLAGPNLGDDDAFLIKYNSTGEVIWARQFGTDVLDRASGVAVDQQGSVYVSGRTSGHLGGPPGGWNDGFISKFDADGVLMWSRQYGAGGDNQFVSIASDGAGGLYVGGLLGPENPIHGGVVIKLNDVGDILWAVPSEGHPEPDGLGNVYVAHATLLTKYDSSGNIAWSRRLDGVTSTINSASPDGQGSVYCVGNISRAGKATEAVLGKYDANGNLIWRREFGTTRNETFLMVQADGLGNVYVAGRTSGSFDVPNAGVEDVFVAMYDALGNPQWIRQFGSSSPDLTNDLAVDGAGNAYVVGQTLGNLTAPVGGFVDAFIAKLSDGAAGDFNADGVVDGNDFLVWQQGLGSAYDADDLNAWRDNFGSPAAGAATGELAGPQAVIIPEPGALPVALTVAVAILGQNRRRYRVSPRLGSAVSEKLPNGCRVSPRLESLLNPGRRTRQTPAFTGGYFPS